MRDGVRCVGRGGGRDGPGVEEKDEDGPPDIPARIALSWASCSADPTGFCGAPGAVVERGAGAGVAIIVEEDVEATGEGATILSDGGVISTVLLSAQGAGGGAGRDPRETRNDDPMLHCSPPPPHRSPRVLCDSRLHLHSYVPRDSCNLLLLTSNQLIDPPPVLVVLATVDILVPEEVSVGRGGELEYVYARCDLEERRVAGEDDEVLYPS